MTYKIKHTRQKTKYQQLRHATKPRYRNGEQYTHNTLCTYIDCYLETTTISNAANTYL